MLTNDGALQARLTQPGKRTGKIYYVRVEGEPTAEALDALRTGVTLNDGPTLPAGIEIVEEPTAVAEKPAYSGTEKYPHQLAESYFI